MAAPLILMGMLIVMLLNPNIKAFQLVKDSSFLNNASTGCAQAIRANISCSPAVAALRSSDYYPVSMLEKACTDECASAIADFEHDIAASCAGQTFHGYGSAAMPISLLPGLLRYDFNLSCITDAGRYCNNVAAEAADPLNGSVSNIALREMESVELTVNSTSPVDECDLCFIKRLQFQADSPYYHGPELASIYQSKTAICSVSDFPLNPTTTFPFSIPQSGPTNTSTTCNGKRYTLQPGDGCHSVSRSQGIGTAWMLMDNHLSAYCAKFPRNGTLCLQNTCKTTTVLQDDTCSALARRNHISVAQLLAWNPVLNRGCYNLAQSIGSEICVSAPGTPYVAPSTTSTSPPMPTTTAPIPPNIAPGTCTRCGQYYCVQPGDSCATILAKYGISLQDFIFLNPEVNADCSNLVAWQDYCVQPVGDINTYPGHTASATTTSVASYGPFSALPGSNRTAYPTFSSALPLASGTRADCNAYFTNNIFPKSISSWESYCALAAAVYGVTLTELGIWNRGLDVSSESCRFESGLRYCGLLYSNSFAGFSAAQNSSTATQSISSSPSMSGDASDSMTSLTPPTTTASTLATVSGTSSSAPTQTNEARNCNKWHTVQSGDSCAAVAEAENIDLKQFLKWNPSIRDCATDLWVGYAYCVGVDGG